MGKRGCHDRELVRAEGDADAEIRLTGRRDVLARLLVPETVLRVEGIMVVLDRALELLEGLVVVLERPVQDRVGRLRLVPVPMFGNDLDEPAVRERTIRP